MADVVALWKGVFMPRPSRGGWSASRWPGLCCCGI